MVHANKGHNMNLDPIPAVDETERMMYEDLFTAAAWPLLDKDPGPGVGGFQFYQVIYTILIKIDRVGHTGASLASADDCV